MCFIAAGLASLIASSSSLKMVRSRRGAVIPYAKGCRAHPHNPQLADQQMYKFE